MNPIVFIPAVLLGLSLLLGSGKKEEKKPSRGGGSPRPSKPSRTIDYEKLPKGSTVSVSPEGNLGQVSVPQPPTPVPPSPTVGTTTPIGYQPPQYQQPPPPQYQPQPS